MLKHTVSGIDAPLAIEKYLKTNFKEASKVLILKLLRKGLIKLDGKKAKQGSLVNLGDELVLPLFFETEQTEEFFSPEVIDLAEKLVSKHLIFEDDKILVINKPAGVASQGGSKQKISIDLALKWLNNEYNTQYKLAHRLDIDTTGVFIIAKGLDSARKLALAFQDNHIHKKYVCVCHNKPAKHSGEIINKIAKVESKNFQKVIEDEENGKEAISRYKVLTSKGKYSLLEFEPVTGRMHQIRVHAAKLGCPIVGDEKYGQKDGDMRLRLHCQEMIIESEVFGKELNLKADMPSSFSLEYYN